MTSPSLTFPQYREANIIMKFVILILLAVLVSGVAWAESWTVFSIDPSLSDGPADITFTFKNNHLTLNNSAVHTPAGSSYQGWFVHLMGQWAVMGTIDQSGDLLPDPYATFDNQGWRIQWSPNTPTGYVAPLLLGYSFNGDGADNYEGYWLDEGTYERHPNGQSATGTLVLKEYTYYPREYAYTKLSNTFYTTNPVPEPSSLAALGLAISSAATTLIMRRRK